MRLHAIEREKRPNIIPNLIERVVLGFVNDMQTFAVRIHPNKIVQGIPFLQIRSVDTAYPEWGPWFGDPNDWNDDEEYLEYQNSNLSYWSEKYHPDEDGGDIYNHPRVEIVE